MFKKELYKSDLDIKLIISIESLVNVYKGVHKIKPLEEGDFIDGGPSYDDVPVYINYKAVGCGDCILYMHDELESRIVTAHYDGHHGVSVNLLKDISGEVNIHAKRLLSKIGVSDAREELINHKELVNEGLSRIKIRWFEDHNKHLRFIAEFYGIKDVASESYGFKDTEGNIIPRGEEVFFGRNLLAIVPLEHFYELIKQGRIADRFSFDYWEAGRIIVNEHPLMEDESNDTKKYIESLDLYRRLARAFAGYSNSVLSIEFMPSEIPLYTR